VSAGRMARARARAREDRAAGDDGVGRRHTHTHRHARVAPPLFIAVLSGPILACRHRYGP
jgi:hypothetical protein